MPYRLLTVDRVEHMDVKSDRPRRVGTCELLVTHPVEGRDRDRRLRPRADIHLPLGETGQPGQTSLEVGRAVLQDRVHGRREGMGINGGYEDGMGDPGRIGDVSERSSPQSRPQT